MTTVAPASRTDSLIDRLGGLRSLLLLSSAVIICAAPFADGSVHMHDWRLLTSVVAPSLMMMLVFALPLDMTMARIFMVDADARERSRLRFVIRVEAITYIVMLAFWTPFLWRVVNF